MKEKTNHLRCSHKRLLAALLTVVMLFSLMPTAFAAQENGYHDPAEHWLTANNRTNELDANAVVTRETFNCGECGKPTSFEVFRTPEYTRNGQTAMTRNVKYSNGMSADGETLGTILDGTPGVDAYYTGYHWTKAVCENCGSLNTNMGKSDYGYLKNVYWLYDCAAEFMENLPETVSYEYTDSKYHTVTTKGGEYCCFCYGTNYETSSRLERHDLETDILPQPANGRFAVVDHCTLCDYQKYEYITAKSVVADYYGVVDGQPHTVTYPVTHKLTADNTSAQIYTGAPGVTTVESKVYVGYASSATVVVHSQKVDLVAFSDITPTDNFTWNSTEVPIITLTNYEDPETYIRLDAGFGDMVSLGRNVLGGEIDHGQTMDASNIYWEYQDDNGNWVKIEPETPGMVYGSERGETNNYLYVRSDATYRACYPIGDKVFTSPKPMVVRSAVDYDDYPLNLIPSTDSTVYGGGATISANLTPVAGQSSEWSNDLNAVFQCISWPDGAKIPQKKISYQPSNASSAYNQYFTNNGLTVQTDAFFRGSESNVYPGTYTYRVTVYDEKTGRPQPGGIVLGQERRTSFDVSVTYEYTAKGADIYIDGENISNQTDSGCYLMPGNTSEITLETRLYPTYATKMPSGTRAYSVNWQIVGGEYVGTIVGQGTAATFTAKQPGKATVRATIKDGGTNEVFTTVDVDIIVPIAGFTVEKPELVVGDYVSSVLPTITSVWSYGGEKITNNIWAYLKVNHFTGSTGKVKINTSYNAIYQFVPQDDNRFPVVKIEDETYGTIYEPDMSAISMNTFDTIAVSSDAGRGYSKGDTIVYVPEEAWVYYDYTYDWVRDPNAKYVDFISVTQTTPAVGDTAVYYPGTDWNTIKFLAGEVSFGAAPFDYSSAVYPVTDLLGTGIPYDDASANYDKRVSTTNYTWYANAASHGWYGDPEQFYSEGIHMNELNVYTADGADGTTYYFSPDVMLVVNGHQVKVNVNTGTRIGSYYYFDVGTVDVYDGVTVLGIDAPIGGKTPITADRTLCLNSAHTEALPLYVSRLTWFIDADGDNVCDDGEEALVWYDAEGNYDAAASGLNEDGTFKYNTTYKVAISVALDEGATGRLAPHTFKTSVYTGTVYQDAIMHYDTSGAPTDAVYAYPKTAMEPLTKYEATFTAKAGDNGLTFPLDPAPSNAANHFALSSFGFKDAETGSYVGTNLLEDGKSYIFEVTFCAEYGYVFPEDFAVIINGDTLTSGVTISGSDNYLSIAYPFTLGGGSGTDVKVIAVGDIPYTVSSNVVTTTSANACKLGYLDTNGNYVAIAATANTDGSHSFTAPDGVTEVLLVVKGDATGDGKINNSDVTRMKAALLGKTTLSASGVFAADTTSDSKFNNSDVTRMKAALLGKTTLAW